MGNKISITDRIVRMLRQRRNNDIAKKLHCSRQLVSQIRKRAGIPPPPIPPGPTKRQIELAKKIRQFAKTCSSATEIAICLNTTYSTVRKLAKLFKIELPVWNPHLMHRKLSDEAVRDAIQKAGSYPGAAALLNVSVITIFRYAHRIGVKSPARSRVGYKQIMPELRKKICRLLKDYGAHAVGEQFNVTYDAVLQVQREVFPERSKPSYIVRIKKMLPYEPSDKKIAKAIGCLISLVKEARERETRAGRLG